MIEKKDRGCIAYALGHLGRDFIYIGKFSQTIDFLTNSLAFGADYISTFYVYELGKVYSHLGDLIVAHERALASETSKYASIRSLNAA